MMVSLPRVAIVGRPNVGKSTLLNRIIGRREAIVEERPGVTRDRKEVTADWRGREFTLIDTGGWLAKGSALDDKVSRQAEAAVSDANVVLLVLDARVGVTEEDSQMVRRLRSFGGPLLVVANKVDDQRHVDGIWELMSLGLGEPFPVSAMHGGGVGDLLDAVVDALPPEATSTTGGSPSTASRAGGADGAATVGRAEDAEEDGATVVDPFDPAGALRAGSDGDAAGDARSSAGPRVFAIALVGRPNVGKSTLFNRLIGEERSVVHDMPGTTRDTVDTVVETRSGPIRFLDTAGMRRRSRIDEDTEYYSVVRALKSVDGADVALLVIDATEGVTQQDQRLAERVDAAGCPIVLVLNKMELLSTEQREALNGQIRRRLGFLPGVPVHRISALSGKGVHKLLPSLDLAIDAYQTRIPTRKVNDVVRRAQQAQPASGGARILYATQGATDPPTFTLFTNRNLHDSYVRYIERSLREAFDFGPTPIKIRVRRRSS
ncbi:MAG: ribosome biogenesis GTPase Der [Acidimicrobiales bacterium]